MQALERVREHAGLTDSTPFGRDDVESAKGFQGTYTEERSASELVAMRLLRDLYERTTIGPLEALLAQLGLSVNIEDLRSEFKG
jgi:hypothetical protein